MHMSELLAALSRPAAGVYLALTRRCPLSCAHCSTASTRTAEQAPAALYRRFVGTFTAADRPDFLLLTGGEPLLRPALVAELARVARAAGSRTYLLTGAYFARAHRTPPLVAAALRAVDHVAVSLDEWHQREVPRPAVFALLHRLLAAGQDVSIQVTGRGDADPYLAELTTAVRQEFADRLPILVGRLGAAGRARAWLPAPAAPAAADAGAGVEPCAAAAWPVVGFEGTVTACANQSVVDRAPLPPHLALGHAAVDGWPEIRDRCLGRAALTALRTLGPLALRHRLDPDARPVSYCRACWQLPLDAGAVSAALAAQVTDAQLAAGPVGHARRYGSGRYADLVLLGAPSAAAPGRPA
jgi:pyruvate-formate lyase-activating enzyme